MYLPSAQPIEAGRADATLQDAARPPAPIPTYSLHTPHNRSRQAGPSAACAKEVADNSWRNFLRGDISARTMSALMWTAFPGRSAEQVAEKAARVLGLSPRQCRNIVDGNSGTNAKYAFALVALIGWDKAMKIVERASKE